MSCVAVRSSKRVRGESERLKRQPRARRGHREGSGIVPTAVQPTRPSISAHLVCPQWRTVMDSRKQGLFLSWKLFWTRLFWFSTIMGCWQSNKCTVSWQSNKCTRWKHVLSNRDRIADRVLRTWTSSNLCVCSEQTGALGTFEMCVCLKFCPARLFSSIVRFVFSSYEKHLALARRWFPSISFPLCEARECPPSVRLYVYHDALHRRDCYLSREENEPQIGARRWKSPT